MYSLMVTSALVHTARKHGAKRAMTAQIILFLSCSNLNSKNWLLWYKVQPKDTLKKV